MKKLYLLLAVIGLVLPYTFFVSFLLENELNLPLLVEQLFANDISTFFVVDLIITAVVLILFITHEAPSYGMQHYGCISSPR